MTKLTASPIHFASTFTRLAFRVLVLLRLVPALGKYLLMLIILLFVLHAQWGLVNFDCSAMWVRDRKHLTDTLDITPEFLRSKHGDEGLLELLVHVV